MADPLSISTGQGRGMAQVFPGIDYGQDFRQLGEAAARQSRAEQADRLGRERQRQSAQQAAAKIAASTGNIAFSSQADYFTNAVKGAYEFGSKVPNPSGNPEFLSMIDAIKTEKQATKQIKDFWEKEYANAQKVLLDVDKYDDETVELAQQRIAQLNEYSQLAPAEMIANSQIFEQPFVARERVEIDFFKPIKETQVGLFTNIQRSDDSVGSKTTGPRKADVRTQAEGIVSNYTDRELKKGIEKGLFTDRQDAVNFYESMLIAKANTSSEDLLPPKGARDWATGRTRSEIENNFQQWRNDLISGNEEAAGFLIESKTPNGMSLRGFRKQPLTTPVEQQGTATPPKSRYRFDYLAEGKTSTYQGQPFTPSEDVIIDPNQMTEEELFKAYLNAMYARKKLYREGEVKQTTIGGQSLAEKFKGVPKGGF